MNFQDYLLRIGIDDKPAASAKTLSALQFAHMKTVPFENLDVTLGNTIKLDVESLWNKIVIRKRGGFCYEVNGLFAWLLKEIGFEVVYLNARVYDQKDDSLGIDFDHLTLMVKVPNESTRWLVDVGWGDTFTQPLNIDNVHWQEQGLRAYRIESFQNGYQLWQRGYDGKIDRQYYFDLTANNFPFEYEAACVYHQTSPDSIFTKNRIITRLTEDGRISLDNDELIITKNGEKTRSPIREDERAYLLKEHFGVFL